MCCRYEEQDGRHNLVDYFGSGGEIDLIGGGEIGAHKI